MICRRGPVLLIQEEAAAKRKFCSGLFPVIKVLGMAVSHAPFQFNEANHERELLPLLRIKKPRFHWNFFHLSEGSHGLEPENRFGSFVFILPAFIFFAFSFSTSCLKYAFR